MSRHPNRSIAPSLLRRIARGAAWSSGPSLGAFAALGLALPAPGFASPSPLFRPRPDAGSAVSDLGAFLDAKGNRIRPSAPAPRARDLWAHLDYEMDGVPGTSTVRAYASFALTPPAKPVLVALIDSGVDLTHPDLQGMFWTNEREAAGQPGVDDDGDGYIDDVYGWNFIGNADGRNLGSSTMEVTREVARMRALARTRDLDRKERAYQAELEARFAAEARASNAQLFEAERVQAEYLDALARLRRESGLRVETVRAVERLKTRTAPGEAARRTLLRYLRGGADSRSLAARVAHARSATDHNYDLDFDPSSVIGDRPSDLHEGGYGNPDVTGPDASHGTHCAGIIGALRDNGIGIDGQSNFLRILPIRAVPDGDERDKDVANAIRFAVDHGARIISMSFGKPYSPQKRVVDEAVAYAAAKDVLLVHAAGNDHLDTDQGHNFPTPVNGAETAPNWIEVGASSRTANLYLPAYFSNFGRTRVDLFAPGVHIESTVLGGEYASYDGTSMATPEVAGIAALVLSQRPDLTAVALKRILMGSVRGFADLPVSRPGSYGPATVPFGALSVSGGIVNAYGALRAAGVPLRNASQP